MSRWLIVEDNINTAEALAQMLLKFGYDVGIAYSGGDAMRVMDEKFCGVIIDLNLPDMSGSELLMKLRKKFPRKAFGLITGEDANNLESIARRCCADFWMTKPIDGENFLKKLAEFNKKEVERCCANSA